LAGRFLAGRLPPFFRTYPSISARDDYPGGIRVENWDEVLPAIEDYGKARDKLSERIGRLLEELASKP
jgi:hypothetical protein